MDCAALPPCSITLANHIKTANFVAKIYKNADNCDPTAGEKPTDYGWINTEDGFQPLWFTGSPIPVSLIGPESPVASRTSTPEESSQTSLSDDEQSDHRVLCGLMLPGVKIVTVMEVNCKKRYVLGIQHCKWL